MSRLLSFIYNITEKKNRRTRLILFGGLGGFDSDLFFISTDWIKMAHKSMESGREAAASLQLLVIEKGLYKHC